MWKNSRVRIQLVLLVLPVPSTRILIRARAQCMQRACAGVLRTGMYRCGRSVEV
eukprot:SAG11_NODE_6417_length_1318_cov_2.273995_3_plen_53_part_01